MPKYGAFKNYQDLVSSYSQEPRDVHTIPLRGNPIWFFTYVDKGFVYVKPAHSKTPSSQIRTPRKLNPTEFDTMLELYHQRNKGRRVSDDATRATQNQVYWYGIFHDMGIKDAVCETASTSTDITDSKLQKEFQTSPPSVIGSCHASENSRILKICGYKFHFVQQLIPELENGRIKEYAPQKAYVNRSNLPLGANGTGTFCRFSIHAPAVSGVYLWVVDDKVIYIGETVNLVQRFNSGYGYISPRNCYAHGQSTNCKMNKVVMEYYKSGKMIDLYFLQTEDYKQIELDLLHRIHTKYNVKDN